MIKYTIQDLLRKTDNAARRDQTAFTKWDNKKITIEECMELFARNNRLYEDEKEAITKEAFVEWLHSLGYRHNGLQELQK